MPKQDQFYALLKERVETTRKDHEIAVTLLREFERMFAVNEIAPAPQAVEVRDEEANRGLNKDGSPRKKPGPAKGTNVNAGRRPAQVRAKASAKAAQPAKTKKATALKKNVNKVAAKGRDGSKPGPKPGAKRDNSRRNIPSLIEAIQMVVGRKTMNAEEVHTALKAKGWLPASSDPLGYIRYTLSKNKDIFLRVEGRRGHYFLDQNNPILASKTDRKNGKPEAAEATSEAAVEATDNVVDEVDDLLAKSGVDISGPNPYADQTATS